MCPLNTASAAPLNLLGPSRSRRPEADDLFVSQSSVLLKLAGVWGAQPPIDDVNTPKVADSITPPPWGNDPGATQFEWLLFRALFAPHDVTRASALAPLLTGSSSAVFCIDDVNKSTWHCVHD